MGYKALGSSLWSMLIVLIYFTHSCLLYFKILNSRPQVQPLGEIPFFSHRQLFARPVSANREVSMPLFILAASTQDTPNLNISTKGPFDLCSQRLCVSYL